MSYFDKVKENLARKNNLTKGEDKAKKEVTPKKKAENKENTVKQ